MAEQKERIGLYLVSIVALVSIVSMVFMLVRPENADASFPIPVPPQGMMEDEEFDGEMNLAGEATAGYCYHWMSNSQTSCSSCAYSYRSTTLCSDGSYWVNKCATRYCN